MEHNEKMASINLQNKIQDEMLTNIEAKTTSKVLQLMQLR
jgi:hypothetical protein